MRVVEIDGWSRELCGGTHVRSTAEIGPFAILSEGSVGSGARRIEARDRGEACALLRERAHEAETLRDGARARAQGGEEAGRGAQPRPTSRSSRRRANVDRRRRRRRSKGGELRDLSDRLRKQEQADGAIVASVDDGRAYLVVNFDESLVGRGLDAASSSRELGKHIGGGGGGRPTLAEAGGKNPDGAPRRARGAAAKLSPPRSPR